MSYPMNSSIEDHSGGWRIISFPSGSWPPGQSKGVETGMLGWAKGGAAVEQEPKNLRLVAIRYALLMAKGIDQECNEVNRNTRKKPGRVKPAGGERTTP